MKIVGYFALALVLLVTSIGAGGYYYLKPDSKAAPIVSEATRITLDSGDIIGYQNNHRVSVWQGIPYAAPPIGELRWKAPRSVKPWQNVKSMLRPGNNCASQTFKTSSDNNDFDGSEDCLYLNIYAPENAENLPVMFWIHGGANNGGSSSNPVYDGSQLAAQYQVVVVTINYRLTAFGWLSHPALRLNPENAADASSNFGTLDQIEGLKWVQRNIQKFGGNSGKVTIFGESAGGWNVMAMMASPLAKNLFHGAIVQSGGLDIETVEIAENYQDEGGHQHSSRELINQLIISDGKASDITGAKSVQDDMSHAEIAKYLRDKSTDDIFQAFRSETGGKVFRNIDLIGDGVALPKAITSQELFSKPANYNAVPVMLGTNRDEMKIFLSFSPDHVNTLMGLPISIKDKQRYAKYSRYSSELWKVKAVDRVAKVMREGQGDNVFAYRFDADDLRDLGFLNLQELLGAAHGLEVLYVFGNFSTMFSNFIHSTATQEARRALSKSMMSYWAAFAHHGKPGKGIDGTQIEWTAWQNGRDEDRVMILDTVLDKGIRMSSEILHMEDLKKRFLSDTSFTVLEEFCEAYKLLFTRDDFVQLEYDSLAGKGCNLASN
jgi:para-nitrobenzyl esterase